MICPRCKKRMATVRYTEVVDGEAVEHHLCDECLSAMQANASAGFEYASVLPANKRPPVAEVVQEAVVGGKSCPTCGTALETVLSQGRVGCGTCYSTFGHQVEAILEGLHRALQHKGKVPHFDDARAKLRADLQTKRTLLRTMLRAEKYEEAAALRDEIRSLEVGLSASESGAD